MTDIVIIRRKVKRNFTTLPNDLIRDPRLSWGGLGLLVYILHLPDNFRLRLSHLSKQKASGRDATRARVGGLQFWPFTVYDKDEMEDLSANQASNLRFSMLNLGGGFVELRIDYGLSYRVYYV